MENIKNKENILFDLDGTIVDSGPGVTNSVKYALEKFGIHVNDTSELYGFMGPPLSSSFPRFYNFTYEQTEKAIEHYREYYRDRGIYEFELYDGIKELIIDLCESGKNVFVATTKPELFAREIIKRCSLDRYIRFTGGSTFDGTMEKKADIIKYVVGTCGIDDSASCVMIGDRMYDIEGAAANRISSVGILYGYGGRKELEDAGANYIAETVSDLRGLLLD